MIRLLWFLVAFALGVLARDIAQDFRELAAMEREKQQSRTKSIPDIPRPRCSGPYILKQADGGRWTGKCLKA